MHLIHVVVQSVKSMPTDWWSVATQIASIVVFAVLTGFVVYQASNQTKIIRTQAANQRLFEIRVDSRTLAHLRQLLLHILQSVDIPKGADMDFDPMITGIPWIQADRNTSIVLRNLASDTHVLADYLGDIDIIIQFFQHAKLDRVKFTDAEYPDAFDVFGESFKRVRDAVQGEITSLKDESNRLTQQLNS